MNNDNHLGKLSRFLSFVVHYGISSEDVSNGLSTCMAHSSYRGVMGNSAMKETGTRRLQAIS